MKRSALSVFLVLIISVIAADAGNLKGPTDMAAANEQAGKEHKALFILFGRPTCGNCSALKSMIERHEVRLSPSAFIVADINGDTPEQSKAFHERYKITGNTFPFVVIARADGAQVASRTGYGSAAEFNSFISKARRDISKPQ